MWNDVRNLFSDEHINKLIQELGILFYQFCKTRNERISQKLSQITVNILLINPENRFIVSRSVLNSDKQLFLNKCYHFLFDEQNISSLIIKMQSIFHGRYLNRESFKDHRKQIIMKNCYHLMQKLKKSWHSQAENFKEMHNDLVQLVLIKEGMEDQDDQSAFDEMKTAINCIFPPSALSTFVASNQRTKMAFINEISSIAAGIRLHAWYSQKAGKFMFDVGKIMKETLPKITEDIYDEMSLIDEKIKKLQDELPKEEAITKEDERNDYNKFLLIFYINYYKCMKIIKDNIQEVAEQTYKLDYNFNIQVKELDFELNTGPFSKADKVYPGYKDISRTWKSIQLEGHLLNFYSNLYQELKTLSNCIAMVIPEKIIEYPINPSILPEISLTITKVLPEDVKNFSEITLEYQEFCTFYCSKGILIPCKRDLGIIIYKNKCYGFSSIEALEQFIQSPADYITLVKQHILAMPELILTLQMETYFNFPFVNIFKSKRVFPIFISDSSVQTILHPIEKKIDYTYNWNQWDLRKKALQYVDLMNRKTHSTQTIISHFRRDNYTQVYLLRDQGTQTRRDASTNISKAEIAQLFLQAK